jgi:serine phosphatase RsbU (regulator of sigma subunit)
VRDLGSYNGTFLNERAVDGARELRVGDRIRVGQTVMEVTAEERVEPTLPTPPPAGPPSGTTVVVPLHEIVTATGAHPAVGREPSAEPSRARSRAFDILSEGAGEFLSQRSLEEVLEVVMDMVYRAFAPDRAALMLLEGDPPALQTRAARRSGSAVSGEVQVSRTIAHMVLEEGQAILTADATQDPRFAPAESVILEQIHAALCVPLFNNREIIGLVYADRSKRSAPYARDDLEALTLLANIAAVKIENVRLFLRDEQMRIMERELAAAARIQQRLLPRHLPEVGGYELAGHNTPCRGVGGDLYDFRLREGSRLVMALGDVSGKGMGAALLMATTQAALRAYVSTEASLEQAVSRLNRHICSSAGEEQFVTLFCAELEPGSGRLRYVSAGHNPSLLLRSSGQVEHLPSGGMVLGVLPELEYESAEASLEPGDLLVAYSDGITECHDPSGELFEEERLERLVAGQRGREAEAVQKEILAACDSFVGSAEQFDDMTLALLRRC